jgi:hypothetical protein
LAKEHLFGQFANEIKAPIRPNSQIGSQAILNVWLEPIETLAGLSFRQITQFLTRVVIRCYVADVGDDGNPDRYSSVGTIQVFLDATVDHL